MTRAAFNSCVRWFVAATKPTADQKVLLIVDNHDSRFAVKALKYLAANHVVLLTLPPNSTALLQPLDVAVFGALKKKLHELVDLWSSVHNNEKLQRRNIAPIVFQAWDLTVTHDNIVSGFAASGCWDGKIQAVNPQAISDKKLGPAAVAHTARVADPDAPIKLSALAAVGVGTVAGSAPAAESKGSLRDLLSRALILCCVHAQRLRLWTARTTQRRSVAPSAASAIALLRRLCLRTSLPTFARFCTWTTRFWRCPLPSAVGTGAMGAAAF